MIFSDLNKNTIGNPVNNSKPVAKTKCNPKITEAGQYMIENPNVKTKP